MPELSRSYGIVIRMYFDDHMLLRFRAAYGGEEAVIGINGLAMLHGRLPPRAQELVVEWASLHQAELRAPWNHAMLP